MEISAARRLQDLQSGYPFKNQGLPLTTVPTPDTLIRALVYGSCVARDVIRVVPGPFDLAGYIARQSWVSAFTEPLQAPKISNAASTFQARNVRGDFESNAGDRIAALGKDVDVILIDIASDRHGVAAYAGGYVSLTPDHSRVFGGMVRGGTRVPFGGSEHLRLFVEAIRRGKDHLMDLGLFDRTLVLGAPFTPRTTNGEPIVGAAETAADINAKYGDYYGALSAAGFSIAMLPDELAVADSQHTWGLAQDHYADPAYHWWADQIMTFVSGTTSREHPVD